MSVLATSAFAPDFVHTSVANEIIVTFDNAPTSVAATIPTGTYRMCLAPSASDFIRVMQARINAALATATRSETVTCSLSAAGVFSLVVSSATHFGGLVVEPSWQGRLGFTVAPVTVGAAVTADVPVWHLALLSATKHGPWLPKQAGGTEQTTGGRVYAIAATLTSWQRKHAVSFQPTTPAQRVAQGADATALLPAPEYMGAIGSTATAREWSVLDVLYSARNAPCGLALDNWQTVRTSTSEAFYYGYIAGDTLLSPELTAADETWDAWSDWTLGVVLPTSGQSITRA